MATILTIEFDLARDLAILRTPFSNAEFSDTETGRALLFRAIRANAEYRAGLFRKGQMKVEDVEKAVAAYDLKEVKKFTERGRPVNPLSQLKIDLGDLDVDP